jgi:hypothetical protein
VAVVRLLQNHQAVAVEEAVTLVVLQAVTPAVVFQVELPVVAIPVVVWRLMELPFLLHSFPKETLESFGLIKWLN